jgi:hypothetical protein
MPILLSTDTFNRFDKSSNDVNSLLYGDKGGTGTLPYQGKAVQRLAKLTAETTTTNGGLTWQAEEVYLDATGAVVTKPNGYEWTDDNPVFTLNAATQDAVLLVSQSGRPAVNPDPAKRYWFGNPGGGGGGGVTPQRLQAKADVTLLPNVVNTLDFRSVSYTNGEISANVNVIQNKVSQAFYEEDEIIYGILEGANYILDPYLFAQGIQNASV